MVAETFRDLLLKPYRDIAGKYGFVIQGPKIKDYKKKIKRFRRKALGLFHVPFLRKERIFTLKEFANLLVETAVASSANDGKEIAPLFVKNRLVYINYHNWLYFEEEQPKLGNKDI